MKFLKGRRCLLNCEPGHVYFSGVTGFQHQVQHAEPPPAGTDFCTCFGPRLGDQVEVSIMLRTSMFAHERARIGRVPPRPKRVFQACSAVIAEWLREESLLLPTLAQCQAKENP